MGLMTRIKTWWMSMTPAEKVSMAIGGIGAAAAIAGTMRCAKEMEKLRKQGHHIHITLDDGDSVFEGRCDGFGKGEAMKRIGDSPAKTPEPEKTENEEPAQESAGTALDRSMDILKTLWRHDDCPFSEDFCEAYDKAGDLQAHTPHPAEELREIIESAGNSDDPQEKLFEAQQAAADMAAYYADREDRMEELHKGFPWLFKGGN